MPLLDDLYAPTAAPLSSATGPQGALPLTEALLRDTPSGDLFGWTQNAGMGWEPALRTARTCATRFRPVTESTPMISLCHLHRRAWTYEYGHLPARQSSPRWGRHQKYRNRSQRRRCRWRVPQPRAGARVHSRARSNTGD